MAYSSNLFSFFQIFQLLYWCLFNHVLRMAFLFHFLFTKSFGFLWSWHITYTQVHLKVIKTARPYLEQWGKRAKSVTLILMKVNTTFRKSCKSVVLPHQIKLPSSTQLQYNFVVTWITDWNVLQADVKDNLCRIQFHGIKRRKNVNCVMHGDSLCLGQPPPLSTSWSSQKEISRGY